MEQTRFETDPIFPPTETLVVDDSSAYIPGEIQIDEHGRLLKRYTEYNKFLSFIPQGMDNWIEHLLPLQLASRTLSIETPVGTATLMFTNPFVEKPMLSTSKQVPQKMWPEIARRRYLDYSGALFADLVKIEDGLEVDRVPRVYLGLLPVMIGSKLDHLYGLTDVERLAKGECPHDPGCYFISRGDEKVVLFHEKVSTMKIVMYNGKTPGEVVSKITNEMIRGSTVVTVTKIRANTLQLSMSGLGKNNRVNVLTIFSLLGMSDPEDALRFILTFTRNEWADKVLNKLNSTFLEFRQVGDPVTIMAELIPSRRDEEGRPHLKDLPYVEQRDYILNMLRRDLYPQLPNHPDNDRRRLAMLAQQTVRLLEYMAGFRKLDDRDDWSFKRLDPAAESFRQLFQGAYGMMMNDLADEIAKKNYVLTSTIAQKVKATTITNIFSRSLSSNNFGIKGVYQKNIVDQLKNANLLDAYSHLTRVRVTGQERSHVTGPRRVQATAAGFICPFETPERDGCGIVKNSAITTTLTIYDPSTDPVIIDAITPYLSQDRNDYYDSKCWFNGAFYGWCPGLELRLALVEARRSRYIPITTEIVVDADRVVTISTTPSRLVRPLLVMNTDTRRLIVDEKNLWSVDFDTLLTEGAVEYIDPFEQNIHAYIAETIQAVDAAQVAVDTAFITLGQAYGELARSLGETTIPDEIAGTYTPEEFAMFVEQARGDRSPDEAQRDIEAANQGLLAQVKIASFTHCELDPQSMWGFAASAVDLANHNVGPRITYQCQMGKQSLGISNSHQRYRFPTSTKRLAFPTRCVFDTQTSSILGFNDLPTGTSSVIAIIADAWNQEDSFLFNEGSLQRGMFRYIKEFSKSAAEKKVGELEEIITRPPIRRGEPEERYSQLDENGIIRVHSVVNPRDAIIGRIRRNVVTDQEENATIFAAENEHGTVEEVLITTSREGKKIVTVKIRDTRVPKRGDKFALKPSQKGTIGLVVPQIDMPMSVSGVVPDLIMNPLAFPSRMTAGTLMEILGSKVAVMTGNRINATAYRDIDLPGLMDLLASLGYQRTGDETFYSGESGFPLKGMVFTGIAYVQKLKHDVEDKIQARAKGPVVPTTHQPTRGKAHIGGQKIGEMEGWAMMSHGAAGILKEKLCDASDATPVVFCTTCGRIANANHLDNRYECRQCGDKGSFARGVIPYVEKSSDQYLHGMNMGKKYRFRSVT